MSPENSPSLFVNTPRKSTIVFDSDSETDSIKTDTTAESEPRDEYEVERILMEAPGEEHCYLVKWEGYKLFRSTWEPPESLVGDETLAEWERQKKRIAAGEAEPFNYDVYEAEFSKAEAEKREKRRRRNAKRQKRGLPIRTYSSEEDADVEDAEDGEIQDEDAHDQSMANNSFKRQGSPRESPKATKRTKQPDVARRGVAKKVPRRRVVSETSSSDNDSSGDETQSSGADSLQEELAARASRSRRRSREPTKPRNETAHSNKSAPVMTSRTPASTTAPQRLEPTVVSKPAGATSAKAKTATQIPHKAGPSGAARKSAPSHATTGPAKKPRDVLANWDAPKKRKERPRVSEATPKDSTDPKFTALSIQGRYQKYGRENERAPDFNALTVIDPKTGKTIPPKSITQTEQTPPTRELSSVYNRRTPPPQERRRSLTPPSPNRAPAVSRNLTSHESGFNGKLICSKWLTTGCPKSARNCDDIHPLSKHEVNHFIDKRNVTCWYWFLRGACAYGSGCEFAHTETGVHSSPPGSGQGFFTVTLPPPGNQPPPSPPHQIDTAQTAPRTTSVSAQPVIKPPSRPACRAWLEERCPYSAETCSWAHTLPTEPYKGDMSAIPKHQALCYYVSTKRTCSKGTSCAFSHVDTGIQAGPPREGLSGWTTFIPKPITRQVQERSSFVSEPNDALRQNSSVSKAEALAKGMLLRELTCFFWRTRGQCAKSDEQCEYAHRDTGTWAAPPPGFKQAKEDARPQAMNANMVPIAVNRHRSFTNNDTTDPLPVDVESRTMRSPGEIVGSPLHMLAAPMPPPDREDLLRRQSLSTPAGSLATTLNLSYSSDQHPTQLQVKLELSELHVFGKLAGADPQLTVNRVVLASDFKNLVWDEQLRDSEFTVGSILISDVGTGQKLVDLCKQHTVGLVATQIGKKSRMLIYPPSDDVWKFLDTGSNWKTESALRFRLFSCITDFDDLAPGAPLQLEDQAQKRHSSVITGEELAKLDSTRLLPVKDKLNQGARTVFLMFPPAHHVELEYYAKFFGGQHYRVYHSGVAGAWHYFCKTSDRKVVVVHPDVPIWQAPDLKQLLKTGTGIFSIGLNQLDPMDNPTFGCERLFPYATAVLFTDDVFVYHPDKALEVLESSIKTVRGKGQEYKIVTRPGVKEWLLRSAEEQLSDRGGHDDRWLRLYDAICRLCPPEDEDPHDSPNPGLEANLVSLSPELFPRYDALWRKDEAAATNLLVEWFAGWTIENMGKLRKLHVLYEPKGGFRSILDSAGKWPVEDPSGWVKKYQHIWFQKPEDVFAAKK